MSRPATIAGLLERAFGLDPAVMGPTLLDRAVGRRLRALGLADPEAYRRRLADDPEELAELAEELAVPETWFYRDATPFQRLHEYAADWVRDPRRPPLRALSLACATGEEPYSIALALSETGLTAERFRVLGIDLSARALAAARGGVYGARSLRGLDAERLRRHFVAEDRRYAVGAALRRSVEFRRGNLTDPDLLAGEPRFDVIFCRNVLIYLTAEARERVVGHIRRLLGTGGLLFLGHADRSEALGREFAAAGGFAYRRREPAPPTSARPPVAARARPTRAAVAKAAPRRPGAHSVKAQSVAAQPPAAEPPLLERAAEHAGRGEYGPAAELCEQALRRNGPSARAFHLLGVIAQAQGDFDRAEHWLGKAVFLDAQHDEALLALSLLAGKRGDPEGAARYRRRAERARRAQEPR
jgi:chemotaxis protein methyltransferase WspC